MLETPPQSVVWTGSLNHYRILGSQAPTGFERKFEHFPTDIAQHTCAVFVDILRATTTLVGVAAAGCKGIYVDIKPKTGDYPFVPPHGLAHLGRWVFGGELDGKPIIGKDEQGHPIPGIIGNSPCSITKTDFADTYLRFFSTNGSRALGVLVAAHFRSIHALSLANIETTVDAILRRKPDRIWFTCGGFYGSGSLEDNIASGIAINSLLSRGFTSPELLDDEAHQMLVLGRYYLERQFFRADAVEIKLREAQVGRLMHDIGHQADIGAAVSGRGLRDPDLWSKMAEISLVADPSDRPFVYPELVVDGAKSASAGDPRG
ncbi:phosphosulfolactate phosphohydrolase-like enzyme [Caulobacter ginsengisoli]|uniref:Probable 2-phosphosulfolactate phosphatase n=1 Tax=Caulobacter ginsengisoli TaxID=400775 RepID=A0ABU0IZ34_9CAUL|nr:2-phosphosulfolactate phosphatase [Caulobacter ginsengisoli]MDQ0466232.1 phosphosulfolactate phosphohydrolase-like enzyme [Caulobacter ginsengisoli]